MKLTKENLLCKTHFGLKIYAHILGIHYLGHKLSLAGNHCLNTKNPFNANRPTLHISIKGQMAVHQDLERPDLSGDVFDFARLHYNTRTPGQLYELLNRELKLGLLSEGQVNWLEEDDDSWRPMFSFFRAPISNVLPSQTLSLAQLHARITGQTYADITAHLRSLAEAQEKRRFKAQRFDYVTFSGIFSKRKDDALLKASMLMVLDFDQLPNLPEVRQCLLEDTYFDTELLFTSPSGNGLKWVIRHDQEKASYRDYFLAVSNYLWRSYQLKVDGSGRDTSRACFIPADFHAFLHSRHRAEGRCAPAEG